MTTPMKTEKVFDCLEYKRRVQLRIHEEIKDMTHDRERAYFQEQADRGPMGDWWRRVKTANQIGGQRYPP
jgi:hypothetical protein